MKRIIYLEGEEVGINKLLFVKETPKKGKDRRGLFTCYCGLNFIANIKNIRYNITTSCGCYNKEKATTHGLSEHRLYHVYMNMRNRCLNEKNKHYSRYGGRGITISLEFKSFHNYIKYVEALPNAYKENLTIDRIANSKGYFPGNLRWATRLQQTRNRDTTKLTNLKIIEIKTLLHKGLSQKKIAEKYNVSQPLISYINLKIDT